MNQHLTTSPNNDAELLAGKFLFISFMDLRFHQAFSSVSGDYLLLEVNEDVLHDLESTKDGVHIVGKEKEEAVLTTSNHTYRVRSAESSNCSLLLPTTENPISAPGTIHSCVHSYYELQKIAPRFSLLKEMLKVRPFDPEMNEGGEIGYTTEELTSNIQASEGELKKGLIKERAFMYKERWQILSERYERELFALLLLCIQSDESSSIFKDIRLRTSYNLLAEEMMDDPPPLRVVRHLLHLYSTSSQKETSDEVYLLDATKVMQFYAITILLREGKSLSMEEFLKKWNAQCPSECRPHITHLKGIAMEKEEGAKRYMAYFPVTKLSSEIRTRFNELFAFRAKWSLADIQPYLHDLSHSMTTEQMLFKFTRNTQTPNGKVYTKR